MPFQRRAWALSACGRAGVPFQRRAWPFRMWKRKGALSETRVAVSENAKKGRPKQGLLVPRPISLILRTNDGQLKPGRASWGNNHVCAKGFLAYGCGGEDAKRKNSGEARRILKKIREKSTKHASGVIIEVSMWGIHKACRHVAEEWGWAGKPHCFTRVTDRIGTGWTMPSEDAVVRALWVDFDWPWEASDSWLF